MMIRRSLCKRIPCQEKEVVGGEVVAEAAALASVAAERHR
jgi:hypothetical protein